MSNDNQTNLNENNAFIKDEDTQISPPPPTPDFETAQPAPVQPVVPVTVISGDPTAVFPQQPQVVYVAQPTTVEPKRSWGWIPAALALLVIATVAGVFIGAELYKRSIYGESNAPYSSADVSPYADSNADKSETLADKKESVSSENNKFVSSKSESKQISTVSNGFAQIQQTDLKEDEIAAEDENAGEENDREVESGDNAETEETAEKQNEKNIQKSQPENEEAPSATKRKPIELQPRKVENVKDTENVVPPQRGIEQ